MMRIECEWQLAPGSADSDLAGDQRTHSRHLPGEGIGLRLAVQPTYRGHRAVLYDISTGGIGLLMEQPLEVGTTIAVDLRDRPSDGVCRIARVAHVRVHTTPQDAPWAPRVHPVRNVLRRFLGGKSALEPCWFVGCRFDSPLSEDELSRLLPATDGREVTW